MNHPLTGSIERAAWTKDRVSTLRKLWLEGLSATEIGQRLGCTRNAVLGKVQATGTAVKPSVADQVCASGLVVSAAGRDGRTVVVWRRAA